MASNKMIRGPNSNAVLAVLAFLAIAALCVSPAVAATNTGPPAIDQAVMVKVALSRIHFAPSEATTLERLNPLITTGNRLGKMEVTLDGASCPAIRRDDLKGVHFTRGYAVNNLVVGYDYTFSGDEFAQTYDDAVRALGPSFSSALGDNVYHFAGEFAQFDLDGAPLFGSTYGNTDHCVVHFTGTPSEAASGYDYTFAGEFAQATYSTTGAVYLDDDHQTNVVAYQVAGTFNLEVERHNN